MVVTLSGRANSRGGRMRLYACANERRQNRHGVATRQARGQRACAQLASLLATRFTLSFICGNMLGEKPLWR